MCILWLVRHGQSEWNAVGKWQGQADPPLTALGRQQAEVAAEAVGTMHGVWTSDLQRAADTAAIIANSIGIDDVTVDPRLRERDAGEWSGLTHAEIREQYPGFLDDGRRPNGWEPEEELQARALAAVADIAVQLGPGGRGLIATHSGLIYTVESALDTGERKRIANLGARELRIGSHGISAGPRHLLLDPDRVDVTSPDQL